MLLRKLVVALSSLHALCASVSAEPMRLDDPTPRWVVVQFEDSPSARPDLLDRVYTQPFAAWLEPDGAGRLVVRIGRDVLEQHLFRDNDPLPGSFSDYVWLFDPASGEVLSASFSGAFSHQLDWGFARSEVVARVHASMQTGRAAGFRPARSVWGHSLLPYCDDAGSVGCTRVPGLRYDATRGYVNAVGSLTIDSPVTRFATYSAVGEARFSEVQAHAEVSAPEAVARDAIARDETPAVASGPPEHAAEVGVASAPPAL